MKRNPKEYNKFKQEFCLVCGKDWPILDIDHIKTFKSGGKDEPYNCWTLCRFCHIEKGSIGLVSFAKKYENARNFLITNGWQKLMGKWIHE